MRLPNSRSYTAFLAVIAFVQVTLSLAQPIRLSRTAEVGTSGGNLLYANTQQQPTPPALVQGQDEQITTDENTTDLEDVTSSPLIVPSNDKIPAVVETVNENSKLVSPQVQTEVPASPSALEVDPPLFYPPRPVEQPKYRLPAHYSPPLQSKPQPSRRYNSNDRLWERLLSNPACWAFLRYPTRVRIWVSKSIGRPKLVEPIARSTISCWLEIRVINLLILVTVELSLVIVEIYSVCM
ncbi:hypothetical protein DAPPUDRAFT_308978 [Daphnia pulex]|uniref:Uncharacterized protein n=1 Tax=Daphnia pulex TaxID=6669 RepID=E9G3B3_DAPPU|nr:hypothetical protein DAPPUDRAFT_308978 [Daphnia pulex]|eukprot:EFX86018.1 hypothetical protein DAPPUDRAFT_308978 [Daphnia pulex]